jgi:glutaredoxin-like protein NrdH
MRHLFHHPAVHGLPAPVCEHAPAIPLVYVEPGHPGCACTLAAFRLAGAAVEVVDITGDDEARHALKTIGYQSLPVVNTGQRIWARHQPALIMAFAESPLGQAS